MDNVADIRGQLRDKLECGEFVGGTIEIVGAHFLADKGTIFGTLDYDYIARELDWYLSQDLNVAAIGGDIPKIWQQVSSVKGEINSNYGYLLLSAANGHQYEHTLQTLIKDQNTRRAVAIYTRPTIHEEWNRDGMSDFICTNAVQYLIRDKKLHVVVQMRSNDAVFGYKNDRAWQCFIQDMMVKDLKANGVDVGRGSMIWSVASLHVYERHYGLVRKST